MNTQRKRALPREESASLVPKRAPLRLVGSEPGVPPAAAVHRFSRRNKADQDNRRMRNCGLMLVAVPFMEELSRRCSKFEHTLRLTDSDGNVLCSIGRESRTVSRKLFKNLGRPEVSLGTDRAKAASRKPFTALEHTHPSRPLAGQVQFGSTIRDLDELSIGAIHLSLPISEAKPKYKDEVVQLADLIAVAWIQKIALPMENAALANVQVW